jgi:hypothetical protein
MKYTVEIGSVAIPSFIKIGSGIQELIERYSEAHRQHGNLISLL